LLPPYNTEHNITVSVNLAPQSIAMATLYDKQTGIRTVPRRTVPRYALLHVVYRFNKQPKKK